MSLLSFGTHVEKCLSDGVCDNASVVSTIKVFSDKLVLIINYYTSVEPSTSGLYSLPRDSRNYKSQNRENDKAKTMQKKKKKKVSFQIIK